MTMQCLQWYIWFACHYFVFNTQPCLHGYIFCLLIYTTWTTIAIWYRYIKHSLQPKFLWNHSVIVTCYWWPHVIVTQVLDLLAVLAEIPRGVLCPHWEDFASMSYSTLYSPWMALKAASHISQMGPAFHSPISRRTSMMMKKMTPSTPTASTQSTSTGSPQGVSHLSILAVTMVHEGHRRLQEIGPDTELPTAAICAARPPSTTLWSGGAIYWPLVLIFLVEARSIWIQILR